MTIEQTHRKRDGAKLAETLRKSTFEQGGEMAGSLQDQIQAWCIQGKERGRSRMSKRKNWDGSEDRRTEVPVSVAS